MPHMCTVNSAPAALDIYLSQALPCEIYIARNRQTCRDSGGTQGPQPPHGVPLGHRRRGAVRPARRRQRRGVAPELAHPALVLRRMARRSRLADRHPAPRRAASARMRGRGQAPWRIARRLGRAAPGRQINGFGAPAHGSAAGMGKRSPLGEEGRRALSPLNTITRCFMLIRWRHSQSTR